MMDTTTQTASTVQLLGAGGFGALIGWYVYYINRYRKGDVQLSDLVTLIGAIGGGAVLTLFPAKTDLFGAYGIGLALGFFGYFLVLIILVAFSKNFDRDWFLDGRRKLPDGTVVVGDCQRPMAAPASGGTQMEAKGPPTGGQTDPQHPMGGPASGGTPMAATEPAAGGSEESRR